MLVLLFDTTAEPAIAGKLHAATCSMVRGAPRHVQKISEDVDAEVRDLIDRGFGVTRCRCCGRQPTEGTT
jgi:hypothetical protein